MRILANIPSLNLLGGVASHFRGLRPFWRYEVRYNVVGRRGSIPGLVYLFYDLIKFVSMLVFWRCDCVLLNPSLGRKALLRDAIFLWFAKRLGKRVVVFFHGWDSELEMRFDADPTRFIARFGEADAFIVLASRIEVRLRSWGVQSPIFLSSTKVDNRLLDGFDVGAKRYSKTLLFLARVEREKGIFVALEAFSRVLKTHPDAKFIVAGSGSALSEAIDFVRARSIKSVQFLGNISGQQLVETFGNSDLYLLPTFHGEGMPTSVLEAMAFGLPVITRPVGGLVDFFEDGRMGFLSESVDPDWFASAIEALFWSPELMKQIGTYNHSFAKGRFLASKVASEIEDILVRI